MSGNPTLSKIDHPRYRYRVYYTDGGKRLQKYFKKKTGEGGADEFIGLQEKRLKNEGVKEKAISSAEARAVVEFREAVAMLPGEGGAPIRHYIQASSSDILCFRLLLHSRKSRFSNPQINATCVLVYLLKILTVDRN